MNNTQRLQNQGQSLWLDNITRDMLNDGTLRRYRDELSITGLTSNPTIFEQAIGHGTAYDDQIRLLAQRGMSGEALFAELAMTDLQRAADLFRPIFDRTEGRDGWVSMEVSPLLIDDSAATVAAARQIHTAIDRPNVFVKIPGSAQGVVAIEQTIVAGIPVNVTLLFSTDQYLRAAGAYMRALERRLAAGLDLAVSSVASVFVSRWDKAIEDRVSEERRNLLGIAVARNTYKAYWDLLNSARWRALEAAGARPQRLLWASTGTKDPKAPASLYVSALGVPNTINTMPEKTLLAFADEPALGAGMLAKNADAGATLADFKSAGIDTDALAADLQSQGGNSFKQSWRSLLDGITAKQERFAALSTLPDSR